jgi:L-lactate dehydrogenase complex protein LldE
MSSHRDSDRAIDNTAPEATGVALFVTCLADLMRPATAFAAATLLERAGFEVIVPPLQSCCGQPGYNSGDYPGARAVAQRTVQQLEPYRYVVLPSGSCAGMLREHYPRLLDGEWADRAAALASRVYELTEFLTEVAGYRPSPVPDSPPVAYHDGCAGLRELGVRAQPRQLLRGAGFEVRELELRDVCCGFGGTFCAKMPEISAKMADDKLADIERSGASEVVAGDLGCLLALAGRARRRQLPLRFRHVAEVLAGEPLAAPIGEPGTKG